MRRTPEGWACSCDGAEFESDSLHEAISDAVGHQRGEALRLHANSHDSIERWVSDQAVRIEREAAG